MVQNILKTIIHLFASLHLCVEFQLASEINGLASHPAGEADPANPVIF
jgi:hypothetical protein